jgi:lysozyme
MDGDTETLTQMLIRHEGIRLKPYTDTVGKLTIGVGRNLDDVGITYNEAMEMLQNDISRVLNDCLHAFPWFADLTSTRQAVVIDMCFNLGLTRLQKFTKFLQAVELGDYDTAADEMLNSLWAKQVKNRALEMANLMRGAEDV